MKLCTLNLFTLVGLFLISSTLSAQTGNENTILQIAQGDKLVLTKDLNIPANTDRVYFGLKMDSGFKVKVSGCAIVVNPSQKSRRVLQGGELIFSGLSEKDQFINEFKYVDYTYTAGIMNSDTVLAVECYGTSFKSTYQDLYVSGLKNELKENFDFVSSEPDIVRISGIKVQFLVGYTGCN
ncbi:MAG: hypothetical protein ACKOA8_11095 [Deltaproteobacteria bacterium]